ncbi:30S ribosome-binding factor RbfA [Candidatus Riflebacteria bacterium]
MPGKRRNFTRADRLNPAFLKELSFLLQRKVKDPRCANVVLVDVEVSRDLSHAKIYYQLTGFSDFDKEIQKGLENVSPFLRGELGKSMHVHTIPALHFIYDDCFRKGTDVLDLLSKLSKKSPNENSESITENDTK